MEDNDAQQQLEKRARRRLVGAVAFVSVVAAVLPMVMDNEPRQAMQDVEIRIPGQDEKPFAPKFAVEPVVPPVTRPAAEASPAPAAAAKSGDQPKARVVEVVRDREPNKPVAQTPEKPLEKVPEKPADKPVSKSTEKADGKTDEARRAAAILAGQSGEAPAAKGGEYLVLIGAFSNAANVKNLQAKLAEQGIKVFTEPLDTPQGRKTRVRAGPFASREAADKALVKMQKIGVSGVVAARQ